MQDKYQDSDLKFIQAITNLLVNNNLDKIDIKRTYNKNQTLHVHIRRRLISPIAEISYTAPKGTEATTSALISSQKSSRPPPGISDNDPTQHPGVVLSPMVGTVYLQPEPEAATFIKIKDEINKGDTILIIEAMKTMNRIPAPHSGIVKRILIENESVVEYGSPLIIIE